MDDTNLDLDNPGYCLAFGTKDEFINCVLKGVFSLSPDQFELVKYLLKMQKRIDAENMERKDGTQACQE